MALHIAKRAVTSSGIKNHWMAALSGIVLLNAFSKIPSAFPLGPLTVSTKRYCVSHLRKGLVASALLCCAIAWTRDAVLCCCRAKTRCALPSQHNAARSHAIALRCLSKRSFCLAGPDQATPLHRFASPRLAFAAPCLALPSFCCAVPHCTSHRFCSAVLGSAVPLHCSTALCHAFAVPNSAVPSVAFAVL